MLKIPSFLALFQVPFVQKRGMEGAFSLSLFKSLTTNIYKANDKARKTNTN